MRELLNENDAYSYYNSLLNKNVDDAFWYKKLGEEVLNENRLNNLQSLDGPFGHSELDGGFLEQKLLNSLESFESPDELNDGLANELDDEEKEAIGVTYFESAKEKIFSLICNGKEVNSKIADLINGNTREIFLAIYLILSKSTEFSNGGNLVIAMTALILEKGLNKFCSLNN